MMDYNKYLKSDTWQGKRKIALERAKHRCQLCNSSQNLEVHHRTYQRLGKELPEDLTVLCRKCHKAHSKRIARMKRKSVSQRVRDRIREEIKSGRNVERNKRFMREMQYIKFDVNKK